MTYRIVPVAESHIPGFRETSDAVFKESQMFAFFEAPSIEHVTKFVLENIRNNDPQFVAMMDDTVVGWCDILSKPRPAMRHSGVLGVGVLKPYRRQGIGTSLIETTLGAAKDRGVKRVELYVRTDNEPAKKLYEKFGFVVEGVLRNHLLIGGAYRDSYLMAILYDPDESGGRG
jgi:RimJ/RimL family protein N-acetyltransferase